MWAPLAVVNLRLIIKAVEAQVEDWRRMRALGAWRALTG